MGKKRGKREWNAKQERYSGREGRKRKMYRNEKEYGREMAGEGRNGVGGKHCTLDLLAQSELR